MPRGSLFENLDIVHIRLLVVPRGLLRGELTRSLSRNSRWDLGYGERRCGFDAKHQSTKAPPPPPPPPERRGTDRKGSKGRGSTRKESASSRHAKSNACFDGQIDGRIDGQTPQGKSESCPPREIGNLLSSKRSRQHRTPREALRGAFQVRSWSHWFVVGAILRGARRVVLLAAPSSSSLLLSIPVLNDALEP